MSLPIIIQIIGMHGVGKTTVAAKAAELFGLRGLRVATLDVDHFAHAFLATPVQSGLSSEAYRAHVLAVADSVKNKLAHPIGLGAAKTTNAIAITAVNHWIDAQHADVILLEMHWPSATIYYRQRDELWLVTATPDRCRSHLVNYKMSRADGLLSFSQKHWRDHFGTLPREKRHVPNQDTGFDVMYGRIARFVECLYHVPRHLPDA